jgi:hypothetical protein
MSEHADMVVVHYLSSITALVCFDLATGILATSHAGLRETLRRGLQDWGGTWCTHETNWLFSRLYMITFFSMDIVHWLSVSGLKDVLETYRV